jgi:hypothetical protein
LALAAGAEEVNRRELAAHMKRIKSELLATNQTWSSAGWLSPPIELSTQGEYTLYLRPDKSCGVWQNLMLIRKRNGHRKQKKWIMGWNGQRLSRNSDTGWLVENEPEIYQWIEGVLAGEPRA